MMPRCARCRVCGESSLFAYSQPVIGHEIGYFDCARCGYFQTEPPWWLEQAYARAINDVDTGILWRNQLNARRVVMTLVALGRLSGTVVDHAGGYGILVRLLRDLGIDARWRDKYCQNLVARGFEAEEKPCDLITAFEVFEHLENPLTELQLMLTQSPWVLISTELIPTKTPPKRDWWYLGTEHGQHIGFFRRPTLRWMAERLGCHHTTDGVSLHLFGREPIPWSWRHLVQYPQLARWVAKFTLRSKMMEDFDQLRKRR